MPRARHRFGSSEGNPKSLMRRLLSWVSQTSNLPWSPQRPSSFRAEMPSDPSRQWLPLTLHRPPSTKFKHITRIFCELDLSLCSFVVMILQRFRGGLFRVNRGPIVPTYSVLIMDTRLSITYRPDLRGQCSVQNGIYTKLETL